MLSAAGSPSEQEAEEELLVVEDDEGRGDVAEDDEGGGELRLELGNLLGELSKVSSWH